ncbi:MAG: asparagine synthase (glutamine-hydrolyzing) [Taibaiella sp.]|nr:asparagine synthase (glutamine-hydrolyzing) [Taibaiella sp.]
MCGIAGLIRFDNKPINEELVTRMRDSLAHRGPDGAGTFIKRNVALAHRRLSILDLSDCASQPFTSADGRYTIIFNGEIYNYKEFIPELEEKGVKFRSTSDTEVLLYLYILYGSSMLLRLEGMWAFAIHDDADGSIFVCRDRLGVKPIYYAQWDNAWYFASEPKALFTIGVPLSVDENGLNELFFYRYIAGANTIFQGVFKILPGHFLILYADGRQTSERYWNLGERSAHVKLDADPMEWFEYNFNRSIRYRMVSDVPVGILLSGGLDSSAVAYSLASQGYKGINTFTIRFTESELNESVQAEKLAKSYGFDSHTLLVEDELLYENMVKAVWAHDEPLIHQSDPHLVAISAYSKSYVKVLLSGEGADELMGGYVRYKPLKHWDKVKAFSSLLDLPYAKDITRLHKLKRYLQNRTTDEAILLNASNFYPEEFFMNKDEAASNIYYRKQILQEAKEYMGSNYIKQVLYLDQHIYLQSLLDRNDRTTMAAGIECREPFLSSTIVEGLMSLPASYFVKDKKGKYILANSIGKQLPDYITNFKKVGLGVPWERYLRQKEEFRNVLLSIKDSNVLQMGLFKDMDKETLITQFFSGDDSQKMLIRFFFFIRLWETEYLAKF